MPSSAKYVTHTILGPIPHLRVEGPFGPISAPVKLVTDGKRLVTSELWSTGMRGMHAGFPRIQDHRFVHALPGGGETLGELVGYFEEQRYSKRLADLLEHWNSISHETNPNA